MRIDVHNMSVSCSRIPHLVRALAEKRQCSSTASPFLVSSTKHKPSHRNIRTASSGARPPKRPVPASSTVSTTPTQRPLPKATRSAIESKQDVYRQAESLPLYDPSKDPKKVKNYLIAVSCFGVLIGTYVFYVVTTYRTSLREYNESPQKLEQDADVSDRWHDEKRNFDYEVDGQEKTMWMKSKRRRLIREAYGDVLEVSVGTGRNMDLYDTRPFSDKESRSYGRSERHMITSLTFNDQSPVMLQKAREKWDMDQKRRTNPDKFTGKVNFVEGDARVEGVITRPPGGYDTIVQSMGVCSMAEPAQFLQLLGRLVRQPNEPVINTGPAKLRQEEAEDGQGGRIFLLEHGRGYDWFAWLNRYLDNTAAMHANRYGCWYNKDIGKVVEDSGLVVERIKRHYFGTVWEIVLRPRAVSQKGTGNDSLDYYTGARASL